MVAVVMVNWLKVHLILVKVHLFWCWILCHQHKHFTSCYIHAAGRVHSKFHNFHMKYIAHWWYCICFQITLFKCQFSIACSSADSIKITIDFDKNRPLSLIVVYRLHAFHVRLFLYQIDNFFSRLVDKNLTVYRRY